jgi:hypothetical protein
MEIVEKIVEKKREIEIQYREGMAELERQYQEKKKEVEAQYREKITALGVQYHEKIKEIETRYHRQFKSIRNFVTWPIICGMIVPLVMFDICMELYHRICFPLYGIPLVVRKNYMRIKDRTELPYLNTFDKIFCAYCGYANGLIHYAFVIAGETEKYWCSIKHKKYEGFIPAPHQKDFLEYGDKESFEKTLPFGNPPKKDQTGRTPSQTPSQ